MLAIVQDDLDTALGPAKSKVQHNIVSPYATPIRRTYARRTEWRGTTGGTLPPFGRSTTRAWGCFSGTVYAA